MNTFASVRCDFGRVLSAVRIMTIMVIIGWLGMQAQSRADVVNWPTNGWVELYGQETLFSDVPNDTGNNGCRRWQPTAGV